MTASSAHQHNASPARTGAPSRRLVLRGGLTGAHLQVQATDGSGVVTMTQQDGTTCGATTLLGAHLLLGGSLPTATSLGGLELPELLGVLQRSLQRHLNRNAAGGAVLLPWTRHLGSTPWAVAAEMTRIVRAQRPQTLAYHLRWVRDYGQLWPQMVERLRRHLAAGEPVVLLTGGPLRHAPAATDEARASMRIATLLAHFPALPRHYVLAVPWELLDQDDPGPGQVPLYEPSAGTISNLDLLAPRDRYASGPPALGYWPRVLGVIMPGRRKGHLPVTE
ncbi:HAD family hydrolase [Actinomyces trachealis]|uniref:HAD family hydrolase n=1 Tax=Actinomyces trachealis TaxID=2763540 RepID=UPI001892B9F7|nr:HAD family hydrolase [Actinomyces trachealis]